MKKIKYSGIVLVLALSLVPFHESSTKGQIRPFIAFINPGYFTLPEKYEDYADKWKVVKGFDEKGLPRSAMKEAEEILALAKKNRNAPQIVKAQIHRIKYLMSIGEQELPEILRMLENEIKQASFPEKQIFQSLLAEAYWNYFSANRYAFYKRTQTTNASEKDDISTWSLGRIFDRIVALYRDSVSDPGVLMKIPLGLIDEIVVKGGVPRTFRPTLYDFLAHRAVDFFMIDEHQLTKAARDFEIDSPDYFKPAEDFFKMNLGTADPSSLHHNALVIFKKLTQFHLEGSSKDPGALVDVEVKRLKFIHDKATIPEKTSLYINGLRALENRFRNHPSSALVSYEIAQWYRAKGMEWKEGSPDDHQWSVKKSVELCSAVMKRFPDSEGDLLCRPLTDLDRQLSLVTENVNVPDQPFRAQVKYKNISRLYLRTVKISPEMYGYVKTGGDYNEVKASRLLKEKATDEWSVVLPDDGDLREHSAEIRVPGKGVGTYAILCGTDKSFSFSKNAVAYIATTVSNLSFVHRLSRSEGAVFNVFSRDSGQPLKEVKVVITERYYDNTVSKYVTRTIGNLVTDANGTAAFPLKRDQRYYHGALHAVFQKNDDRLKSEFYSYIYKEPEQPAYRTYFFTDRSIYRPGQVIHFKAILLELDKKKRYGIMPDHDTAVEFFDYNNQRISQVNLRTNKYGTVSGSFTAPSGVLTGQMTIRNNTGSTAIRVEEYKRPKFEAGFEPVKGNYRLGDKIKARGFARSYSGAPLSDAQVKYSVVRRVWFMYRWWGWYYRHYNGQQTVIKKGETRTGAQGEFSIDFEAIPDRRIPTSEQPAFYYEINADVTDINGETHSAGTGLRAGYTSLIVEVSNLPANVDPGTKLALALHTTNFSGEFLPARGRIAISLINEPERLLRSRLWEKPDRFTLTKEEYVKNFPHDIYNDEDEVRARGVDKKIFSEDFDTALNKTIIPGNIKNWPDGDYLLEIDTKDSYGEKIHIERNFSVYSPKEEKYSRKAYLHLVPLQNSAEPGSEARLAVGSYAKDMYLLLDIIRKGEKIEKKTIRLSRDKKIIAVPVKESDRGNVHYRYAFIKNNRLLTGNGSIYVPWTNKNLKVEFSTFRNKLRPGEKEEWRIKISGHRGEMAAAELAASMYDASLDSFYPHYWHFNINPNFNFYNFFHSNEGFVTAYSYLVANSWNEHHSSYARYYDELNLFGAYFYSRGRGYRYYRSAGKRAKNGGSDDRDETLSEREGAAQGEEKSKSKEAPAPSSESDKKQLISGGEKKESGGAEVQVRRNLNETAFFYPQLLTNEKGEITVSFTAPESLTRWRILGFAHTSDLKSAVFTNELITQKELMVTPNVPRFFREGDTVVVSSKISNLTDAKITGKAELLLFDAVTMKPVDREFSNEKSAIDFAVPGKGNAVVNFRVKVPESVEAVTWRVVARAGNFSDGEESTLPVLSNRMLVTESMPLPVRGNQTKDFQFTKLLKSRQSGTLSHYRLTLEFTSNPVWYAVQALPYLMEYPHECSEQLFSRFYANSLASHIVNSSPKIKAVFDRWRNSSALLSNLQKNEELKSVLVQETPWLLNGKNEEENKKRVALFFDLNRMANEEGRALSKLRDLQGYSGGWPWFAGLPESRYITQHILAGIAKLRNLGLKAVSGDKTSAMTDKGMKYIDENMKRDYDYLKQHGNLKGKNIGYLIYHYLYTRSFYKEISVRKEYIEAFDYWKAQAARYWPHENPYVKGLAAIALARLGEEKPARAIVASLRELAIYHEELGMYWKENVGGYWWWEAPAETQALLIEAFEEVGHDRKSADDMRTWLLKMKQVQHWNTTKATTDACYALLMGGSDWIGNDNVAEIVMNGKKIDPVLMGASVEAGTGYFKLSWNKNEIVPEMGSVRVANKNRGPAWGALYWQYFERIDRITPHATPLRLEKKFFLVERTDRGPRLSPVDEGTRLKPGDKLRVRIILSADRDIDYVHMKDLRAAGTEPENVLSTHRYQDGLYYYESTGDAATNFFIERLPKGTFVFEYPIVANLKGDFSAGITTVQCMYAPEFTSHSEGKRIRVE